MLAGESRGEQEFFDWFRFLVLAGDTIDVELLFEHGVGDLSLDLYDESGKLEASSLSSDDNGADRVFGGPGADTIGGQGDTDLCNGGITGETLGGTATVTCETVVNVPQAQVG